VLNLEAIQRYSEINPELGSGLYAEVEQALEFAARMPLAGVPVRRNVRKVVLRRFPYSLFYEIVGEAVHIIAVAHQRRRPGYWRHRVE
jgi:plasmid stabilization system protein ParE